MKTKKITAYLLSLIIMITSFFSFDVLKLNAFAMEAGDYEVMLQYNEYNGYYSPKSVAIVGFNKNYKGAVNIPSKLNAWPVSRISYEAFSGCKGITSISIPASVTSVEGDAFIGCTALTSISVNSSNKSFSSENGILYNKNKTSLVRCPTGKSGSFTIKNGVKTIERDSFFDCTKITGVTIPKTVSIIGTRAFKNCTGIKSFSIPSSVTAVHGGAFENCSSLSSIKFSNGLLELGDSAFYKCKALTSVTLPNTLKVIYGLAFSSCTALKSISIPDSVNDIGEGVFEYCTALSNVKLSNNLLQILHNTFLHCKNLSSITIPKSVAYVADGAFDYCDNLKYYCYTGTLEQFNNIEIKDNNIYKGKVIYNFDGCIHKIVKHPATEVTCTQNGNTEYFSCSLCSKYFSDIDGAKEIAINSWIINPKGHEDKNSDDKCDICDAKLKSDVIGDVDCDDKVTTKDARVILRVCAKLESLYDSLFVNADVDGNEKISTKDARLILRYSAKLISSFD